MKKEASYRIGALIRRVMLLTACGVFLGSAAYAQNGGGSASSCTVTGLRLRIATSNDDLRGGQDNLNIVVYFTSGGYQLAPNVNHSQNWPNNSVNTVDISLNRGVPPSEIRALRLVHIADGGFNLQSIPELATFAAPIDIAESFQSPDNWDMADIQVAAIGNGVGARIANHGYFRFTGSNPVLSVATHIPANVCGSGRPTSGGTGEGSAGGADANGLAQNAITNAKVIEMVKAGLPESAIVASIRSNQAKFDLSANALIGLKQAGVSQTITNAMTQTETAGGNVPNSGRPPTVPKPNVVPKPTPAQAEAALAKLKSNPPLIKAVKVNRQTPQQEGALLTALQQQKQAVQSGQVVSPTGGNAAGGSTPGTPGGTLLGNSAGGSSNPGTPSSTNPNNPTGGAGNPAGMVPTNRGVSPTVTRATAMAPVAIAPAAAPPSTTSRMGSLAAVSRTASLDPCVVSSSPVVKGLNSQGRPGAAVFSQDPAYNPFWVVGCHFGNGQGTAYLETTSGFKLADLGIGPGGWSDTLVKVTVDPSLVDAFDQDVTLVIVSTGGQTVRQTGFKFYAMRQEIHLTSVPQGQVSLANIVDDGGSPVQPVYSSPYQGLAYSETVQGYSQQAQATAADKGMTAGADRNGWYRFNGGTDLYNFSGLKPGFSVSRFQIDEQTIPYCYESGNLFIADETMYADGTWNAQFDPGQSQLRVDFAEKHCHQTNGNDSSNSTYALDIWVIGPAISSNNSPWQSGVH